VSSPEPGPLVAPAGRPAPMRAVVQRVHRLSGCMLRVVLGEGDLHRFRPTSDADCYVKLVFEHPGTQQPGTQQPDAQHRPRLRAYTVRAWDEATTELTLDVVVHGERGLGGPWASRARPGDVVHLTGPGGGYAPDPQADWHLLAGDESALPAIAVAAERLPASAASWLLVEVSGPDDEIDLVAPVGARVRWLHRGRQPVGRPLIAAMTALARPDGDGQAFVHGEAGFVRELRRLLRFGWGLPRERLSASGYWHLGVDDEGWRAGKADWKKQVEDDERAAGLRAGPPAQ
jgi:NADPH-dependent ferric siderophore reductase